jgi:hypothetical protein
MPVRQSSSSQLSAACYWQIERAMQAFVDLGCADLVES